MSERTRQLPTESKFDDPTVGMKFGITADEFVQSLRRRQRRAEDPRESPERKVDRLRYPPRRTPSFFEPSQWLRGGTAHEFTQACEGKHRKAEPLCEGESDGVCSEVVAEFVCNDAQEFVIVEVVDGERTHDENVATTRKRVQVVAFVDCKDESALRCAGRCENHSCRGVEPALFVPGRRSNAEHACHEQALRKGQKHDHRSQRTRDHERDV